VSNSVFADNSSSAVWLRRLFALCGAVFLITLVSAIFSGIFSGKPWKPKHRLGETIETLGAAPKDSPFGSPLKDSPSWRLPDGDLLEVMEHPTLGTLYFPRNMPEKEREKSLDRVIARRYGLPERTNLHESNAAKTFPQAYKEAHMLGLVAHPPEGYVENQHILVPDGTYREFPADMKTEDIVAAIEKEFPPKPKQYVQLPDGSYRDFPANATDDEINAALKTEFPPPKPVPLTEQIANAAFQHPMTTMVLLYVFGFLGFLVGMAVTAYVVVRVVRYAWKGN